MLLADNRIRVFLAVAEERSFTQAAYKLGISQPAVSQNIAELENATGRQLFIRKRSEICLSKDGEAFAEYAKQIMYWYNAVNDEFSPVPARKSSKRRRVYIGISDNFDCHFLQPGSGQAEIEILPHGNGIKVCSYLSLTSDNADGEDALTENDC